MLTLIVFTTNYMNKKKKKHKIWYTREEDEMQITTRVTYTDLTQKIVQAEELIKQKIYIYY